MTRISKRAHSFEVREVGENKMRERRVALVIGVGHYLKAPHLVNPLNDASRMIPVLKGLDFDVLPGLDVIHDDMEKIITAFDKSIEGADVALLFFAGHGVQIHGENYLLPKDAPIDNEFRFKRKSFALNEILAIMRRHATICIVFLDACRDNPFAQSLAMSWPIADRSIRRGLAEVQAPRDCFIAFATAPGEIASDGHGEPNGPFTVELLKHIDTPNLTINDMMIDVSNGVRSRTNNRQQPWVQTNLATRFYFRKEALPVKTTDGGDISDLRLTPSRTNSIRDETTQKEPAHWHAIKERGEEQALRDHLARWPPGPSVPWRSVAGGVGAVVALAMFYFVFGSGPGRDVGPLTAAEERTIKPRHSFRECALCPEMVVVPSGSFIMGSPASEVGRRDWEFPQHRVAIARPFAVGKFEVTFAEWDACVAEGGCSYIPDDQGWGRNHQPVINVSWNDITQQYLPWLSRKTGKTYRLLTEAEWEYVARAGTTTPFWWGSSSFSSNSLANCYGISQANCYGGYTFGEEPRVEREHHLQTLPVDSFAPNPWGLYNVHGNAWEWVQDCWKENNNGAPLDGSASTTRDCKHRILRGVFYIDLPLSLRAAFRERNLPDFRLRYFGFRVARTL